MFPARTVPVPPTLADEEEASTVPTAVGSESARSHPPSADRLATPASAPLPAGLVRERLPRHIAIIMDGNGRWAQKRGLPRAFGHQAGAKSVQQIVADASNLGIGALTLYSFSSENWKRPVDEITALMALCEEYLRAEQRRMIENGIRFRRIGQREGLPAPVLDALDETEAMTAGGKGLTLCLALNYGSRTEIAEAVRQIAARVAAGELAPRDIDESTVAAHLYTSGLPDPDLLIRTAGERRISNYLLWQISYAEFFVSDTLWPDFGTEEFHAALRDFAGRERRFGDIAARG